jgi:hypothetical protein
MLEVELDSLDAILLEMRKAGIPPSNVSLGMYHIDHDSMIMSGEEAQFNKIFGGFPKTSSKAIEGLPRLNIHRIIGAVDNRSTAKASITTYPRSENRDQSDEILGGISTADGAAIKEPHRVKASGTHIKEADNSQPTAKRRVRSYNEEKSFPRISKPVSLMRHSYDVVVIGSGYGGGVAASRMARANQSVRLPERGKEKWPREYPSGVVDAKKELRVSGNYAPASAGGRIPKGGNPTGLYHLMLGKGQNAFVGNGLGGTSLLKANIFLEADQEALAMESWPPGLRQPRGLDKYYQRAKDVLEPFPYPVDWPKLPKLTLLQKQAEALGLNDRFYRPLQTTRFVGGPNSTGIEMDSSTLTGQDGTGNNDGSKSSTLVNYLSDAWNWGAEMFCGCEVRYVMKHPNPNGEGYLVYFALHSDRATDWYNDTYKNLKQVHARKCVFLGAGAIGTTEILLRSKKFGMKMSDDVGMGMSDNGDMLALGYNIEDDVNAVGRAYPSPYNPIGPTIAGIIDNRAGHNNPLDGYIIEEGAVPKALSPMLQSMLDLNPGDDKSKGQTALGKMRQLLAQQAS